jgi:hypothetical protein
MTFVWLLAALTASPNGGGADGGTLVGAFRKCMAIAAKDARLDCLEVASAALIQAADQKQVAVVDQESIKTARRARYGLPNSTPVFSGLNGMQSAQPELKEMNGRVRAISEVAPDRYQLELESGALWKNVEPFRRLPRRGDEVTITKAAMNSYFVNIGTSRTGTRCVRIR